jgi:hypothetical protein
MIHLDTNHKHMTKFRGFIVIFYNNSGTRTEFYIELICTIFTRNRNAKYYDVSGNTKNIINIKLLFRIKKYYVDVNFVQKVFFL